jgi:hypothetical protein
MLGEFHGQHFGHRALAVAGPRPGPDLLDLPVAGQLLDALQSGALVYPALLAWVGDLLHDPPARIGHALPELVAVALQGEALLGLRQRAQAVIQGDRDLAPVRLRHPLSSPDRSPNNAG